MALRIPDHIDAMAPVMSILLQMAMNALLPQFRDLCRSLFMGGQSFVGGYDSNIHGDCKIVESRVSKPRSIYRLAQGGGSPPGILQKASPRSGRLAFRT
jgi:hypothetical protein